jgi:hypothetical protein
VADRQKKEADHGGRVEKAHAALQTEEGLFPVIALGEQPVELRVDALKIGGVRFAACSARQRISGYVRDAILIATLSPINLVG